MNNAKQAMEQVYIGGLTSHNFTVRERLQNQKQQLEGALARTNAAIEALDRNPEVEKVMTLVQQSGV